VTPELAQTLGLAAALGFDPSRLLRADPIEAALEHAARFARERDEALAAQIVNRVVDAWNRGQRKAR
jgi:hypothetical protein